MAVRQVLADHLAGPHAAAVEVAADAGKRRNRRFAGFLVVVDADDAQLVRHLDSLARGDGQHVLGRAVVGGEQPAGLGQRGQPAAQPSGRRRAYGGKPRSVEALADASVEFDRVAEMALALLAPMVPLVGRDVGVGGEVLRQEHLRRQLGKGTRVAVDESNLRRQGRLSARQHGRVEVDADEGHRQVRGRQGNHLLVAIVGHKAQRMPKGNELADIGRARARRRNRMLDVPAAFGGNGHEPREENAGGPQHGTVEE